MNRHNPQFQLTHYFHALYDALGPAARSAEEPPFAAAVRVLLGRNANPANVEQVISALGRDGLLADPARLDAVSDAELAERVRPAGRFRQKAGRLRRFLRFLRDECGYELDRLASWPLEEAGQALTRISGVGPETADLILLFACGKPVFPVSGAAARMLLRHGLVHEDADYLEMRERIMSGLESDERLYREFHALLLVAGRKFCKPKAPSCGLCPLGRFLE